MNSPRERLDWPHRDGDTHADVSDSQAVKLPDPLPLEPLKYPPLDLDTWPCELPWCGHGHAPGKGCDVPGCKCLA